MNSEERLAPADEHAETPGGRFRHFLGRKDVKQTAWLVALITVAFAAAGLWLFPAVMPTPMADEMQIARNVIIAFTVIAAPVVGLVLGIAAHAFVNRHRGDGPPPEVEDTGIPHRGVITVWAITSSVLCLVAVVWGLFEMGLQAEEATAQEAEAMTVRVTGSQWVWSYEYPEYGVESDRLLLVVDQPVRFEVSSIDVNHSFWPVQLGVKVDANRLQTTMAYVTPHTLGEFDVKCAELCGLNHAYMQSDGEVVTEAAFATWIESNGGNYPEDQS